MAQWMVLQVYKGKEMEVKWALDDTYRRVEGIAGLIIETLAPVRKVAVHSTKNVIIEPVMKGYVFVRCTMTSHLWHYLKSIPYVLRVLDGSASDCEMRKLMPLLEDVAELKSPENNLPDEMRKRFKEIIETKRNRKKVIRLPLKFFRSLLRTAGNVFSGPVTDSHILMMLFASP